MVLNRPYWVALAPLCQALMAYMTHTEELGVPWALFAYAVTASVQGSRLTKCTFRSSPRLLIGIHSYFRGFLGSYDVTLKPRVIQQPSCGGHGTIGLSQRDGP